MRQLVHQSRLFFVLATTAAFALRLLFIFRFPIVAGDSFYYGDLAKNWLQYGILGTSEATGIVPSLVRLPGYPAFLALIWKLVGLEHYRAVLLVQMFFDVGTCFVAADLARRTLAKAAPKAGCVPPYRTVKLAFLLAALCPFTANYAACVLAETLSIFFAALALDFAAAGLDSVRLTPWLGCGLAVAAAILLRPDGGILLAVIGGYLLISLSRCPSQRGRQFSALIVLSTVALAPLLPWTLRNWRDFHVFQPLAPRYANNPEEFVATGFQRWVKTWMAEYVSVKEIYWAEGGDTLDFNLLPPRAFDTADERTRTASIFHAYNDGTRTITPALDQEFAELAKDRIRRHPLRYYVWLPAVRIADMWLRPRTEMLGGNDRWWQRGQDRSEWFLTALFGTLNLLYGGAAAVGVLATRRWGSSPGRFDAPVAAAPNAGASASPGMHCWQLLLAFIVVRSLFLGTLENPEPRYTLECFPVITVFAAIALAQWHRRHSPPAQHVPGAAASCISPGGCESRMAHAGRNEI